MIEEPMPKNQRILKGIVIILGILIIAMVIIIIFASVMKYNDQKRQEANLVDKYRPKQVVGVINHPPFQAELQLDTGQKVIDVKSNGATIVVQIGIVDTQKIIMMDYTGKIIGTIIINPPN
jgi:flagellar basal body-associated protein FliL